MAKVVEETKTARAAVKEKKYSKNVFLRSPEHSSEWPVLAALLQDGEKYSKTEVSILLEKFKKTEVNN